jgi:5-methylcytosine-specific restriction endonuclease McrA
VKTRQPHPGRPRAWLKPARGGDRKQARRRINYLVEKGRIPRPDDLACVDCGHKGEDRRHEYDHARGYSAEHQLDVEAVCSKCHHARSDARGEAKGARRHG